MTLRDGTVTTPADQTPIWAELGDPRPPQLSIARLALLVSVLAALAAGVFFAVIQRSAAAPAAVATTSVFAPYVDVTLTPTYPFQDPSANPVSNVVLGFVVASPSSPCTPSWGGYYTLSSAESALNLDERISQVSAQGGNPIISFGGRNNTELAVACASVPALTSAYLAPVQRYGAREIDLDIEGAALGNGAADHRRGLALAAAQKAQAAKGRRLAVWLTLPAEADGLTSQDLATIHALLSAHVSLTGVNLMAFDFPPSGAAKRNMIVVVQSALDAAYGQLDSAYRAVGIRFSSSLVWRHLGVTAMIGENDVAGERFTTANARALAAFASRDHIARVSIWSLNRDSQCGSVFPETGVLSNTCSGVSQSALEFTHIFSHLAGTETATADSGSIVSQVADNQPDDPASSPYPVWSPASAYVEGYKVVWHRNVYEAKWYSEGAAPDAPAPGNAPAPWLLIGPVLPGSKAPAPKLLDRAQHPSWSSTAVYRSGNRVLYQGLPFEAKWYTQGIPPLVSLPASSQSPWLPLYTARGEPADPASAQEATP